MTAQNQKVSTPDRMALLTQLALVIIMSVCATRVTLSETLRDAFNMGTAMGNSGVGPGPTTTLLLDLLCWVPVVLILIRRAIDRTYVLRWQLSYVVLILLSLWICASTFWASDRFAACIGASTWCAGAAIAWSASQLVRSWTRLRLVLALAIGLAAIFLTQAAIYRWIDGPEMQRQWKTIREQVFAENHWSPEDFLATQYDRKVQNLEQMGFFKSPNTLAAISALCAFVAAGFVLQRWRDGDERGFIMAIAIPAVLSPLVLYASGSRTAIGGAILCAIVFAIAWRVRGALANRSALWFAIGCALLAAGAGVVICIGVETGGLLQDSLTFRWNYWVASWRMHHVHPFRGVGWMNFGDAYLPFRLAVAAEEVKDPHNFIVRFLTETGAIGALLALLWIGRAARESTKPIQPRASAASGRILSLLVVIVAAFAVLRFAVMFPISLSETEPLKLLLFSAILMIALALGVVRDPKEITADDRPAPLLLFATVVGLGGFMLHNLVDFAMFETGPWLVMMLVLGAVLGVRHASVAGRRTHTAAAYAGLAAVFLALLAYVGVLIVPIATAEAKAQQADAAVRAGHQADALALYREAIVAAPVANFDYPQRATRAMQNAPPNEVMGMLTQAIDADQSNFQPWLQRARFQRQLKTAAASVVADYRESLVRNPQDIQTRLELGGYLDSVNQPEAANEQYRLALETNGQYHEDEPRRIPKDRVEALSARLKKQ